MSREKKNNDFIIFNYIEDQLEEKHKAFVERSENLIQSLKKYLCTVEKEKIKQLIKQHIQAIEELQFREIEVHNEKFCDESYENFKSYNRSTIDSSEEIKEDYLKYLYKMRIRNVIDYTFDVLYFKQGVEFRVLIGKELKMKNHSLDDNERYRRQVKVDALENAIERLKISLVKNEKRPDFEEYRKEILERIQEMEKEIELEEDNAR